MKYVSSLVLAVAIGAAVVPLHAKIERNVEKAFTVTGTGTIHLETGGGAIRVTPGPDGQIKIIARERISADSETEADELLKHLDLQFDQTGNDVRATAKYDRPSFGFHMGTWPPVQVDFIATVPAAFVSDVHTSGGSITLGDLTGAVNARTSGGPIALGKLGGTVDAHTSGGSITLDEARGEVKLDTSGGPITVGRVAGPADLSTSGGSIRIDAVEQSVKAHTSGGSIRATIVGSLKADSTLSTSGGGVHITVDKKAAFNLDASTSGGSVDGEGLTITLEHAGRGHDKLVGAVNGGGPVLKLRSSGGSIRVEAK
jgi:hypothetical protein